MDELDIIFSTQRWIIGGLMGIAAMLFFNGLFLVKIYFRLPSPAAQQAALDPAASTRPVNDNIFDPK